MARSSKQQAAEIKIPEGIPAGHAITVAEEKLVHTVNQAVMDSAEVFQMVGRIQMADFSATVAEKSIAEFFIKIKESKHYKGLPYVGANGKTETVSDLEEFCEVFLKRSYRRCKQLADNYHLIGADLYETSEQLGLGQRDYNAIKALPEDQQSIIIQAIEKAENRETVISLVEELANRNAVDRKKSSEENTSLTKQVSDIKADYEAQEKIIQDKNKKLDAQEKLLHKLQNRSGDWHPRAFEICMENTRIGSGVLEAMDKLDDMRDAILNEDFGEGDHEAAIEAMAVVHYDTLNQIIDRVAEVMAACEEVFVGYKEKARPMLQVFEAQQG